VTPAFSSERKSRPMTNGQCHVAKIFGVAKLLH
jgi:hypothetical protein